MSASTLPAGWDIPATIRNRLGHKAGRQRLMTADKHVLLVLHAPPKPDELERTGRFFWRNAAGDWTSKEMGPGIRSLSTHVEQYEEAVARLDRMENLATTIDEYFRILEDLAPLHRSTRNLYQVLDEARKVCPEDRELINLRDREYAADRNADLLFDETCALSVHHDDRRGAVPGSPVDGGCGPVPVVAAGKAIDDGEIFLSRPAGPWNGSRVRRRQDAGSVRSGFDHGRPPLVRPSNRRSHRRRACRSSNRAHERPASS